MARIVGGIGTTHVPSIGSAIAKGLQRDPYWKPFFDGFGGAHEWLARVRPDVVVVLYNDHGLNFFLDKLPTFAVGAANEYRHADEGWGLPVSRPYPGDAALSWHLIESLVADEFDVTMCQEMLVDHAFTIPLALLWPEPDTRPVRTVPIAINTVQHPLPSPARCFKFGRAIGRAIESYPADLDVLILGTGGLSHQLDGKRAGFINKEFDLMCMDKLVGDPEALARYSSLQIVEEAGSQGVELLNWIAMRGALTGDVGKVHGNYHVPISNTASALLVLENRAQALETTYRKAS
jgi:protocatechuate 4,5-dioxygenase, beta chain